MKPRIIVIALQDFDMDDEEIRRAVSKFDGATVRRRYERSGDYQDIGFFHKTRPDVVLESTYEHHSEDHPMGGFWVIADGAGNVYSYHAHIIATVPVEIEREFDSARCVIDRESPPAGVVF